jgi:hypothetical protein
VEANLGAIVANIITDMDLGTGGGHFESIDCPLNVEAAFITPTQGSVAFCCNSIAECCLLHLRNVMCRVSSFSSSKCTVLIGT